MPIISENLDEKKKNKHSFLEGSENEKKDLMRIFREAEQKLEKKIKKAWVHKRKDVVFKTALRLFRKHFLSWFKNSMKVKKGVGIKSPEFLIPTLQKFSENLKLEVGESYIQSEILA